MPFIEAGDRSYLCAGNFVIKHPCHFLYSIHSPDQIASRDLRLMFKRHHAMTIQGDKLGELLVNGVNKEMAHIEGIIFFHI